MDIFTSYYARYKWFEDKSKWIALAISRMVPIDSMDYHLKILSPSYNILSKHKAGLITDNEYKVKYLEQLNYIGFDNVNMVFDKLLVEYPKRNIVLFCYEGPGKFCHRHIFAEWYNQNAGIEMIKEYERI